MPYQERKECWKMFDQISPSYDKVNRILSLGMDHHWRSVVSKYLPKRNHLRILDLATGTGDQLIALFESGASIAAASGVDLSAEMLEIAKKKVTPKPYWNRIEWIRGDAERLPFDDNTFDAATFSFGLRNMENPLAVLSEIHRALKPHGVSLILEFSIPPKPFKGLYLLYLRHILPRVGGYFSKIPAAYRYLHETIEAFNSENSCSALLKKAQFQNISRHPMAFGAVTLYRAEKS